VLLTTTNKDFRVKHGLSVADGATFGQAIEIGEPTASDHAATKFYVDQSIANIRGFGDPEAAFYATTGNINISTGTTAGSTIDGSVLIAGNRILIKDQTTASQNGIYVVNASGPATRALDFSDDLQIFPGAAVYVIYGTVNTNTTWVVSNYDIVVDENPIIFSLLGPLKAGAGISIENNEINVDPETFATTSLDVDDILTLDEDILRSSLTEVGTLDLLNVSGDVDITGDLNVDGIADFSNTVIVPNPTQPTHAANKDYVDNLVNQASVEITTIDDLSNYFNGYNSRFYPTYKGLPVTLQNPFNLLLTIDGIIQSVGSPDYVWQSVMPRVGFRIDNDGYIAFPEAIPVGSSFDARVLVGSATTTQTKVYPFKAMDIVLGGY
jgi:hypothetical protein